MLTFTLPEAALGAASIVLAIWARGRTGDLVVTDEEARKAYEEICEEIGDQPISAKELAVIAGEALAPDMHWPPRFLASKAHKAAWKLIVSWAEAQQQLADAQQKTLCEVIRPGGNAGGLKIDATTKPKKTGLIGGLGGGAPTNIAPTPTPGRWSKQVPNYGLLSHTGEAYGLGSGSTRLAVSKKVNAHPLNKQYAKYREPGNAFEITHYSPAILSFDNVQPIYYPTRAEVGLPG